LKHLRTGLFALTAALAAASPALAQQPPAAPRPAAADEGSSTVSPRHAAAQAAGYRALHLCTATFSSGLPKDIIDRTGSGQQAKANETVIDEAGRTVTVKFADDMQPRIAAWRPGLGCTQLPIGATMDMVKLLPRMPESVKVPRSRRPALANGRRQGDRKAAGGA
jgi:hypothetical protein